MILYFRKLLLITTLTLAYSNDISPTVGRSVFPQNCCHIQRRIKNTLYKQVSCIVAVASFQQKVSVINILHRDHPGIVRTIRLARLYIWWPNIDSSINSFVQKCETCQLNARKCTSTHLKSWDEAHHFFERVHIHVAHYADKK